MLIVDYSYNELKMGKLFFLWSKTTRKIHFLCNIYWIFLLINFRNEEQNANIFESSNVNVSLRVLKQRLWATSQK